MSDDRTTAAAAVLASDAVTDDRAFLVLYLPDNGATHTRVVTLENNVEYVVGRMGGNALILDYEPVSRRHAKIVRHDSEVFVEDLGSRNGTFVNGDAIDEPVLLSPGDELTIGPATIIVGVAGSGPSHTRVVSGIEFEDRMASELDRSARYRRPAGVLMVRFDGPASHYEQALSTIARSIRRMDVLAQYGPNEFAVLLPECDLEETRQSGKRLLLDLGEHSNELTTFVGVAAAPRDGNEANALLSRARTALRAARAEKKSGVSEAGTPSAPASGPIVRDRSMKRVYELVSKVAKTPITVLILGETGVGKEVVAGSIHSMSDRGDKPFVALNCSALSESLLESELFGHEKGAFTGAERRKIGYFEAANGGTIFLDEVGEMPLGVQAKLLRVLEARNVTRVGGTTEVPVDVRVVCATNRDLEAEVRKSRFREDLFFRLSAFTVSIPPLRDRTSEIMPLATHFAEEFSSELGQGAPSFGTKATTLLKSYPWPGNVRELRNAVERAVVLCGGNEVSVDLLPEKVVAPPNLTPSRGVRAQVAEIEKKSVVAALEACGNNQTQAAKRLGISRFALIRLLNKYDLRRKRTKA